MNYGFSIVIGSASRDNAIFPALSAFINWRSLRFIDTFFSSPAPNRHQRSNAARSAGGSKTLIRTISSTFRVFPIRRRLDATIVLDNIRHNVYHVNYRTLVDFTPFDSVK